VGGYTGLEEKKNRFKRGKRKDKLGVWAQVGGGGKMTRPYLRDRPTGEEIVCQRTGKPMADIKSVREEKEKKEKQQQLGD